MLELFLSSFITLFVVLDPPGCAPIYAGLTAGANAAQRRSMAVRACVIAGAILIVFALFGENLLGAPRTSRPGVHVWLKPLPGHTLLEFDAEARERLKALGYLN